jgi:hypothetical protein
MAIEASKKCAALMVSQHRASSYCIVRMAGNAVSSAQHFLFFSIELVVLIRMAVKASK